MNTFNNKIFRNLVAVSLIVAFAGLMDSCKSKEKCPAYGKAPAKHNTVKNS